MNQSINKLIQVKYIDKNKNKSEETINCEINYETFLNNFYRYLFVIQKILKLF